MSTLTDRFSPVVIPYFAEKENLPPNILSKVYQRLVSDDILPDLVPEKHITEEEFIEFVNGPALLSLFLDVGSNQFAGLAWITNVEEGDKIKKAVASVAFFRDWWRPAATKQFGLIVLSHWFEILGMDLIYAMTPASNVLARKYAQRVGFVYEGIIKGFTSRRGDIDDGMIGVIRKERFRSMVNGL